MTIFKLQIISNHRTILGHQTLELKGDASHILPKQLAELVFNIEQTLNIHYPQVRVHASIEQE
jgi:hypothetical protein